MARYIYTSFISPGLRLDYLGNPVVMPEGEEPADEGWTVFRAPFQKTGAEPADEDWTIFHAADGVKLSDYDPDISIAGILRALPMLPLKLLCPTYSPVNKVD